MLFLLFLVCMFDGQSVEGKRLEIPDVLIFDRVLAVGKYAGAEFLSNQEQVLVKQFVGANETLHSMFMEGKDLVSKEEREQFMRQTAEKLVGEMRENHPSLYKKFGYLYLVETIRYRIRRYETCLPAFLYTSQLFKSQFKFSPDQELRIEQLHKELERYERDTCRRLNEDLKDELKKLFQIRYKDLLERDKKWFDLVVGKPLAFEEDVQLVSVVGPKATLPPYFAIPDGYVKYLDKIGVTPTENVAFMEDDIDDMVVSLLCNEDVYRFLDLEPKKQDEIKAIFDSGSLKCFTNVSSYRVRRMHFLVRGQAAIPEAIASILGEKDTKRFLQIEFQVRAKDVFSFGVLSEEVLRENQLSQSGVKTLVDFRVSSSEAAMEASVTLRKGLIEKLVGADKEAYSLLNQEQRELIDNSFLAEELIEVFMGESDLIAFLNENLKEK